MELMNWQEILTILLPLLALMSWVYNRIEKKADERFNLLQKKIDDLRSELKEDINNLKGELKGEINGLKTGVQSLDSRVSRIEGHLTGMYYHWEPKVIEKKNDK